VTSTDDPARSISRRLIHPTGSQPIRHLLLREPFERYASERPRDRVARTRSECIDALPHLFRANTRISIPVKVANPISEKVRFSPLRFRY